jgi:hypothetical protein
MPNLAHSEEPPLAFSKTFSHAETALRNDGVGRLYSFSTVFLLSRSSHPQHEQCINSSKPSKSNQFALIRTESKQRSWSMAGKLLQFLRDGVPSGCLILFMIGLEFRAAADWAKLT